jgi:hypothetical protein
MIWSKLAEIFSEAIPGGILQMYAFVSTPNRSAAAAGSILISALTTGFGSSLVAYGEFYVDDETLSIVEHFSPLVLCFTLQIMTPLQQRDVKTPNFTVIFPPLVEVSSSS